MNAVDEAISQIRCDLCFGESEQMLEHMAMTIKRSGQKKRVFGMLILLTFCEGGPSSLVTYEKVSGVLTVGLLLTNEDMHVVSCWLKM